MPTLQWIGKDAVVNHHHKVPFHLLKDVPELSIGDPGSGNLIVEGDNLVALKALLPYYAGQVKCIYIDPPYNTGNEGWVYNDNVNSPVIREWLGKVVGDEASDLSRHDKWLCMMYPRLQLLRQFLRPDGVIFTSIDDNEVNHLRCILDECFGANNFIADFVWEGALKNDSRFVSISHDYILCYARDREFLRVNQSRWRTRKEGVDEIYLKVEDLKKRYGADYGKISKELRAWYSGLSKNDPAWGHRHYNKVDQRGVYFPSDISWPGGGGPKYEVLHPITKKPVKVPARGWVFPSWERMAEFIREDRVDFGEDETKVPTLKRYLHETEGQVLPSVFYKDRRAAMKRLRQLFGKDVFDNPKDEEVLAKLFEAVTEGEDVILDSFAGSGTTGHAVLKLNKQDGGNRRFILVELEPKIAREITAERVRRVIHGYGDTPGLGGGFRYCSLGEPLFDERGQIKPSVRFGELARHAYSTETGEPLPRERVPNTPLLGVCRGVGIYLLFNGILGDKSVDGGNVLTRTVLENLPKHDGPKVIYAAGCRLGRETLRAEQITFRQTPYEIKVT